MLLCVFRWLFFSISVEWLSISQAELCFQKARQKMFVFLWVHCFGEKTSAKFHTMSVTGRTALVAHQYNTTHTIFGLCKQAVSDQCQISIILSHAFYPMFLSHVLQLPRDFCVFISAELSDVDLWFLCSPRERDWGPIWGNWGLSARPSAPCLKKWPTSWMM